MSTLPGPGEGPPPPSSTDGQIGRSPDLAGSGTPGDESAAAPAQKGPLGKLKSLFGSPDEPAVAETPYPTTSAAEPTAAAPGASLGNSPDLLIQPQIQPMPEALSSFPPVEASSATYLATSPQIESNPQAPEGADPTTFQEAAAADYGRLAQDPTVSTEGDATATEASAAPDPEAMKSLANDLRTAENKPPLNFQLSGPDSATILEGYLRWVASKGLDTAFSNLSLTDRVQAAIGTLKITRGDQGINAPQFSPEDVQGVLGQAVQEGIIAEPNTNTLNSSPQPETTPVSPPAPTEPVNSTPTPPPTPLT